ncbi:MAG: DNA repair protein RecO C-terminal domain-containing protein [Flavobacteriales bacterium]|nr:DNA repair protein RecO C-terminal domain-containing protein [Flavobacteriales bacterium]
MKDAAESKDLGIVLGTIKHSDGASVLRLFSRTYGVVGCWMREGTRGGRRSLKKFAPLSVLEISDLKGKPGGLFRFTKVDRPWVPLRTAEEMPRAAVAMFLSELVEKILEPEIAHPDVFDALMRAAHSLEHEEHTVWVHLAFVVELTDLLGLRPEHVEPNGDGSLGTSTAARHRCFDLSTAEWQNASPMDDTQLDVETGRIFVRIQGMNIAELRALEIKKSDRIRLLRAHIQYLQLHLSRSAPIKSWDVLRTILAD